MPPTIEDEDDTIIVTGEYEPRLSSPESASPDIEPLAKNLLSHHHLESPEPDQATAGPIRSNTRKDRATSRRPKVNVTTMEERLQQMPELRPLPWRPGTEEGADVETGGDSRRKQIRFGCLLASRGEVQEPGCNSCVNGRGKFSLCIALDGYFKGACASCQLSGRPNRCSIKKEDDLISSPAVGTPNGDTSINQVQPGTPLNDPRPSGPSRKRRRTSEVRRANEAKRASPKEVPQLDPQPPPQPTHYQPILWGQQPTPLPPQPQQINEAPRKTWATVNQPPSKPQLLSNGNNGSRPTPAPESPSSTSASPSGPIADAQW
ncbi:hypothetical protein D0Z07_4335 [Hyphodiscus hymeniophilus]|uniref:Uncharacterized protein n=1 Tax=Hyphodiscus hymeniophilus TaxID=353542 RepID=A0A9P7AY18_9HELO|nr:hypothetical protein D0Z07_4335 [Hyphodiscus hymeniophilus]